MGLSRAINYLPRRLKSILRAAYYRRWFESHSRWARLLERWLDRWEGELSGTPITISRKAWEVDYASGRWEFLRELGEVPRNSVIVGLLRHLAPGGSVLDVGCGEGELFRALQPYGYSRFVGTDISETAITRITSASDERTSFIAANAEDGEPPGLFDVIVFNESLYYFKNPLAVLDRYLRHLTPEGVVIVSAFHGPVEVLSLLRQIRRRKRVLADVRVANQTATWSIIVLRSKSADNPNV